MIRMVPVNMPQVLTRLSRMKRKMQDMSTAHKKISIMLDRWVQLNFKTQGGKVGGWAPIQRNGAILQDTGRLRMSFLPFADSKDAGIGSELPYSKVHEEGIGVTKRRILPELREVKKDIVAAYNEHIRKAVK